MPAMPPSYIRGIAEQLVLHVEDRGDKARVYIAGAGVGDSRDMAPRHARAARMALVTAIEHKLRGALDLDERRARQIADGLVEMQDVLGVVAVRVLGAELVGGEDPHAAAHRARSMRERLVAELQRALSDEAPVTSRRGAEGR